MIVTIRGKYIVGRPKYLKTQTVCNMHANLNHLPMIELLLPPLLMAKYELLHFDDVKPDLMTRFRKLYLISIAIAVKSKTDVYISQDDVAELYHKMRCETMCRICGYEKFVEEHFMYEMEKTLDHNIIKHIDMLSLYCDGCSCVNKLEFTEANLKMLYTLYVRHDLVYKFISNTNFQKCHNVVDTIDNEIKSIVFKLANTCDKIVVMILGITDINSSISSLHNDIIGVLVHHMIHNVKDVCMINKMHYTQRLRKIVDKNYL